MLQCSEQYHAKEKFYSGPASCNIATTIYGRFSLEYSYSIAEDNMHVIPLALRPFIALKCVLVCVAGGDGPTIVALIDHQISYYAQLKYQSTSI